MVELFCGVYGDGSILAVEVDHDADVETLQGIIFFKQRYNFWYKFPPSALTLYLARQNGVWLKDDDAVDGLLKQETRKPLDTQYLELRPSWKLTKPELFGPDFHTDDNEEVIHILVELPSLSPARGKQQPTHVSVSSIVSSFVSHLFSSNKSPQSKKKTQ